MGTSVNAASYEHTFAKSINPSKQLFVNVRLHVLNLKFPMDPKRDMFLSNVFAV